MSTAARIGVTGNQRYTQAHPCPICGGSENDPRGQARRCIGFLSGDGKVARCSREEHAGSLVADKTDCYPHWLKGECKCGREHGPADPKPSDGRWQFVEAYVYRDEAGRDLIQVRRTVVGGKKTFRQFRPDPAKEWVPGVEGVRKVLYRLPELIAADPTEAVYVVEGEKDVDRLRSLGLVATCNIGGAKKWNKLYSASLAGRHCRIVADNDEVGEEHGQTVARSLAAVAASVKVLNLVELTRAEGLGELPEKGDASDFLDMGGTVEAIGRAFEAAPNWRPPLKVVPADPAIPGDGDAWNDLPRIVCGYENADEGLKTWTPKALDALAKANASEPFLFQRDHKMVRLLPPTTDEEVLRLEILAPPSLRGVLDRVAYWGQTYETRKGPKTKFGPPRSEIISDILSLATLDIAAFPPIDLIVEAPMFDKDGRLIAESGFHREARVYYAPGPELAGVKVPERPTGQDVASALSLIFDDLLVDFPFKNQASRANALAVMLLPFARLMVNGPSPNHHFTASTEGTGKGLCATACAYPFLGRDLGINVQKESEAEWRKAITSFLMSGESHYFIDNMYNPPGWDDVARDVDSGTLAAAWTGRQWKDRILGGQDEARVRVRAVFMSSGNNVTFSRELTRRLVNIELVAPSENPSLRTGFKHDIADWMQENRPALVRACLILVRNWVARGCNPGKATMGSYEGYARTMGGILDAAGVVGFLGNMPKLKAGRDRESVRWPALVELWHRERGTMATSTSMLYDLIFGDPGDKELAVLFADIVGEGKELSRKQKFGQAIGKQDGRVWDEWRIARLGTKDRTGVTLYRLIDPTEADELADEDHGDAWEGG